jgi:16S rRNA (adenine1518-N6/adenine1519-N6)-dimethyltransferase
VVFIVAWVRRELDGLGIPPLKRFGQHFLVDKTVREQLIDLAELTRADTVLEVGPGLGFLTAALAAKAGRVIAVEKDRTLVEYLKSKFSQHQNLTVVQGDALTVAIPERAKVVSSPPYNISSKLILLILNSQFQLASLLLQEEFVRRLTAPSGSRDYGRITVMLQCRAQAEFVKKVPRSAFYPKPKVDSALIRIKPLKEEPRMNDKQLFVDMVRTLFTQRRRKLRGVLTRYLKTRYPVRGSTVLQRISLADKRIYELSPDELISLSNLIADAITESERERG